MNPSTALATVLVDELIRRGVREAVLCPGSRSAPFAYALQAADRAGRLRLHVRVDERSAAFLALGLAKGGFAVPVFTTSGTAVANLHPAVLEAHHAGVPLLVVSADRPPELRDSGANQTTDQVKIFGDAVRWFHDLGAPEHRAGQNAVWRSVACRAVDAALGLPLEGDAGPVHLNVPLRDPLVPDTASSEAGAAAPPGDQTVPRATSATDWPEPLEGRPEGRAWVTRNPQAERVFPVAACPRTLVVVGDLPHDWMYDVVAHVEEIGWPVVAEPFGWFDRSTVIPHGPLVLTVEEWLDRHRPDRVLVVGRVTLSRAVQGLLRRKGVRVELVDSRQRWSDPAQAAERVYSVAALLAVGGPGLAADPAYAREADRDWAAAWREAGEQVHAAARKVIDDSWPSGPAVAATILAELPTGSMVFVGSSKIVRDLDHAMSGDAAAELQVVANRGLAGIDGCVSTAVGVALAADPARAEQSAGESAAPAPRKRPAYALMGDLTFLHDTNGLLIGPDEPRPDLTVVVVNDDGGGIFTTLEPGAPERVGDFERVFGTPTGTSIAGLCRAHGVPHRRVETRTSLAQALVEPPQGLRVIEVPVPREGHRDLDARLREAAARALAG
ncbi:MAG TPA: 2-succinyl-5-enolpyruvyl-6-hydroxy-3-cyclohexene-1-carboxylic-acid synthase [Segeticoccus sp.]|uniref:2-succinyl-5-enolpyruvyl-6-hydroxy-3- cyclohexene-1-carboxylic-acid synthase n=1 Tax=Segeticoccus sp. TaxID=2706531 RepID=UPI002D7F0890|nr:2-succinyl-5-enolpyruvyl-6-hydroxy-3-cyclohexene-1-carboxylic-acid synthase [Segeticoccus sp.]HET8601151.1 2-succinyl-5-enolpyruvyl-6-hydroxy-3-cyclohexene-1-carboxylic-acid synthase [Segeticoccus sp.]